MSQIGPSRLPPFGALRAFAATARRGSMVAAADELHVSHGAVSKQIQLLERELGLALFERRNRGLHLTAAGRRLSARLEVLLADLEQAVLDCRREAAAPGPLTLSCEPTLCLRLLIPALPELKAATDLEVRVLAAGGPVDFARHHVDLAVRRGDFALPPRIDSRVLAPEYVGPVVSAAVADEAVGRLPRLHSDTRPEAWDDWRRRSGQEGSAGPDVRYEHFYLALQAAEAGQGMAMASLHMVGDALASGRLRAPFGFSRDGADILALYPAGSADGRIDLVVGWFRERMARAIAEHGA